MRRAIVESGNVVRVVVGGAEGIELPEGSPVGPGWTYNGSEFSYAEPERRYIKVTDAETFKKILTRSEFLGFARSANPVLSDTADLFKLRNGEVDVESEIFSAVMAAAVSDGVLTQERADELSLGIPI